MTEPALRFTGALSQLSPSARRALFDRSTSANVAVRVDTARVIEEVRTGGDEALRALASKFDGVRLDELEVPRARWQAALDATPAPLRRALERARDNIASVHRAFLPQAAETSPEDGIVVGRRPDPLDRVGVYAPGGRASYPSSVLMGAVPARVAGVREVVVCSPPSGTGAPSPIVLAAAAIAEADRVFAIGGAGAIAAMAFGTESVPRVDRIVGPGNAYVAEAKLQLAGAVAIDAPAGPSELLVIADASSDARVIARELVAQAEHDPLACCVVVVIGEELEVGIVEAIASAAATQPRREIIAEALRNAGGVLSARDEDEALAFACDYAPEHLLLLTGDADRLRSRVRNAGTIFVGASSSVAFGDYMTGANHVLPTGGLARSYSGLSVLDFVRWTTWQRVTPDAAARLAADVAVFAMSEGLAGHASAASAWGTR
ncbi:MAG: Histidinol dehydrogenase [Gemmatimonadetes bacterium]|nr:Histidinol dehydrogenase [Gemmatimonadota bacterium]